MWLYHRFALSLRDAEELVRERSVEVGYGRSTSGRRFGPACAAALRRRRPRPGDKWHLDEIFVKI